MTSFAAAATAFGWCFAASNVLLLSAVVATLVGLAAFACWLTAREVYWRMGSRAIVGVCFDGVRVPPDEIARARDLFHSLVNTGRASDHFTLRRVPRQFCSTLEARSEFGKSRRMRAVVHFMASERNDARGETLSFGITGEANAAIDQALWESSKAPLSAVLSARAPGVGRSDMLRHWAESLFDMTVFTLATLAINERDDEAGHRLIMILDRRLEQLNASRDLSPRRVLRRMASGLAMRPLLRRSSDTPSEDEGRSQWLASLRAVSREFGSEFPEIRITLARALFLCDRTGEAREVATGLGSCDDATLRLYSSLALAALDVLEGHFADAASRFQGLMQPLSTGVFSIPDLVDFADYCKSIGRPGAVFLQVLYRSVGDQPVTLEMLAEYKAWMAADGRRLALSRLVDLRGISADAAAPATAARIADRSRSPNNRFKKRR